MCANHTFGGMNMKRFITLLLFFALIISLCSCSDNNQITLDLPTGEVTGIYTGDMEQKLPHGTGTFPSMAEQQAKVSSH